MEEEEEEECILGPQPQMKPTAEEPVPSKAAVQGGKGGGGGGGVWEMWDKIVSSGDKISISSLEALGSRQVYI
jgi:hypothetical protein